MEDPHQVSQSEAVVGDHALDLVELGQVGGVQGFVPEHPVDGEILDRRELLLQGATGEVSSRQRSRRRRKFKCPVSKVVRGLIYGFYIGHILKYCS